MKELIEKADVLLEALPYIQRFRNSTFVIKYGGSFMDSPDPKIRNGVAADIVFLEACGINPIVVHGGGKAITRGMDAAGLKAEFVMGMRVTDEASMKIVEDVLDLVINRDIVETIQKLGGKARGFSGKQIFRCEKLELTDPSTSLRVNLGYVGDITEVDTTKVRTCLRRSTTPVISPIALGGKDRHAYNVNADLAAAQLAAAIGARRLIFMSDVPGLLQDVNDQKSLISHLSINDVTAFKKSGVIDKGMIPKVQSAVEAINAGVHRVHFIDGRIPHSLLLEFFTDKGIGTEIVK